MSIALKLQLSIAVCLVALAFPASSMATTCAPPGVAGVDQYFETVPGASCNHSSGGGGHNGSVPPGTAAQLAKQGTVGQAVKQLVASSGVSGNGSGNGGSGGGHSGTSGGAKSQGASASNLASSGRNAVSGILHPVLTGSSSGGIGVLLPVFIFGALALALLATVLRRRFRPTDPQT